MRLLSQALFPWICLAAISSLCRGYFYEACLKLDFILIVKCRSFLLLGLSTCLGFHKCLFPAQDPELVWELQWAEPFLRTHLPLPVLLPKASLVAPTLISTGCECPWCMRAGSNQFSFEYHRILCFFQPLAFWMITYPALANHKSLVSALRFKSIFGESKPSGWFDFCFFLFFFLASLLWCGPWRHGRGWGNPLISLNVSSHTSKLPPDLG